MQNDFGQKDMNYIWC